MKQILPVIAVGMARRAVRFFLLMACCIFAIIFPARAELGFDEFSTPRPIVLAKPQLLAAASTTNGPIDTHGYMGVGTITLSSFTNAYNPVSTNYTGLIPVAYIGITNLPVAGQTVTITHNSTNQIFTWSDTPTLATDIQTTNTVAKSGTNLCTTLLAFYAATNVSATLICITGTTNDTLLTAINNTYPPAVTNLSGLIPKAYIGITNLPVAGQTVTITHNNTNQVFTWATIAVAATDIQTNSTIANSGTNLCTTLLAFYAATNVSSGLVSITGITSDTLLTAINSSGWGTNLNTTVYSVTNVVSTGWGTNQNSTRYSVTNVVTDTTPATLTATLEISRDNTNWIALTNYANAVSTSVLRTNLLFGSPTALIVTNLSLLPGVLTMPNAATAGWSTTYLVPALFTNSGALTMGSATVTEIAYHVPTTLGYLHVIWTATGNLITNAVVSATFSGVRSP